MNTKELHPGESWTRKVVVYTDTTKTAKMDVTGCEATFKIYDRPGGTVVWTGDAQITDAPNGEITARLSAVQSAEKTRAVLYWVVQTTFSGNRVVDTDVGKLKIA